MSFSLSCVEYSMLLNIFVCQYMAAQNTVHNTAVKSKTKIQKNNHHNEN